MLTYVAIKYQTWRYKEKSIFSIHNHCKPQENQCVVAKCQTRYKDKFTFSNMEILCELFPQGAFLNSHIVANVNASIVITKMLYFNSKNGDMCVFRGGGGGGQGV